MARSISAPCWRSDQLHRLAGLPLLPVGAGRDGKAPVDPSTGQAMTAWPTASWSPVEIAATDPEVVTAVGCRFGPGAGGLLCIDVDGATALESLLAAGCDPDAAGWRITRSTAPDRMKVVFRVPPEQWPAAESRRAGKLKITTGPGEQLEAFWSTGQAVVAGLHCPSGAFLEWTGGPESITDLPPAWLAWWAAADRTAAPAAATALRSTGSGGIDLADLLPREMAELVRDGAPEGSRNDAIFRLAASALAVHPAAIAAGLPVDGTPEDVVVAAAARCAPPLQETEALSCLRSAESQPRDLDPGWPERLRFHLNQRSRSARQVAPVAPPAAGGDRAARPAGGDALPPSFAALIQSLPDGWVPREEGPPSPSKLSVGALAGMLQRVGDRLRFNEMTLLVEVNTASGWRAVPDADMDGAYVLLSQKGWIIGLEPITKAVCFVARQQTFHPVRDYLLALEQDASVAPFDLNEVAPRFFRAQSPLHVAMVRKWLIGAVARALNPGCKMDYCLVLQSSRQGIGKSTSFEVLASPDLFTSTIPDSDKDFLLNVHSNWIFELAELESVTGRRESGRLKNLLTTCTDSLRVPYGRTPERKARSSVFCGTVNEDSFLRDATGNRRFWVVPIKGEDPLPKGALRAARDGIWKAAVAAYQAGELPMLSPELEAESERQNADFIVEDPWVAMLRAWIDGNPIGAHLDPESRLTVPGPSIPFSTAEALHAAGVKRLDQITRSDETRVAPLLRQLGFEKGKQTRRDGKPVRLWSRVTTVTTCHNPPAYGVVTGNPTAPQAVSAPVTTVTTFSSTGRGEINEGGSRTVEGSFYGREVVTASPPPSDHRFHKGFECHNLPVITITEGCDSAAPPPTTTTDWVGRALVDLRLAPHPMHLGNVMAWLQTHGAPEMTRSAVSTALDRMREEDQEELPLLSEGIA